MYDEICTRYLYIHGIDVQHQIFCSFGCLSSRIQQIFTMWLTAWPEDSGLRSSFFVLYYLEIG